MIWVNLPFLIYEKMIADHGTPSWKLKWIVAEVGCRGYIPPSFRKTLVDECSLVSRRSSYYIWLNCFHQIFIPFQMVPIDIAASKRIAVVWFLCCSYYYFFHTKIIFQNCSFSLIFSPNSGFSFYYVSSIWHFFLKRHFHRHACISKVGEKITGGWCLHSRIRFTQAHT